MYSSVVDRLLIILFSLLVATTPLVSTAWRSCDCAAPVNGSENTSIQPDSAHPCCAPKETSDGDRDAPEHDQDHEPDRDCECPLGCCGIVHAPIAVAVGAELPVISAVSSTLVLHEQQQMGSPHLQGLTRPPRPMITL